MHFTNLLLLSGALAVSARPSGHAHRRAHEQSKRSPNFVKAVHTTIVETITETESESSTSFSTWATTSTSMSTSATTSTSSAVASSTSSASASSSSSSSGAYVPFPCGNSKSKRASLAAIAYVGNTGSTYGCNMMEISSDIASLYNYTITFVNQASESYQMKCWNKIGRDGGINGFFTGNEVITKTLAPGGSTVVAFQGNTQGACGVGADNLLTTLFGEFAGTWVEFDFDNTSNNGWSGADASSLVAAAAGMTIYPLKVCESSTSSTCSIINSDGTGTNAYTAGTEALDGVGLNLAAGVAHALHVTMG